MDSNILINSMDVDTGIIYSIFINTEQALAILNGDVGDNISLGGEGAWASIQSDSIAFRSGSGGGVAHLLKKEVINQIDQNTGHIS